MASGTSTAERPRTESSHYDEQACREYAQALDNDPFHLPATIPNFGELSETIEGILELIRDRVPEQAIKNHIKACKETVSAFAALFEKQTSDVPPLPDIVPLLPEGVLLPKKLGNGVCKWFDDYIAFSKKWSGRASYIQHVGCALWILSTIAARRIAVQYGGLQFTPLYIALVAPSSVYAKTVTAKIANEVLYLAGLDWLLGSSSPTPEKLMSNMAGIFLPSNWENLNDDQKEFERRRLAHSGQVGWYYSEFGNLLKDMANDKGRNTAFKAILQRMDDSEPYFDNDTLKRGKERIEMPYLALLGTMTPDCMKPYSTSDASSWGDGTYARFAFCCPPSNVKKTREMLKNERFPEGERRIDDLLLKPLKDWNGRLTERACYIDEKENDKEVKQYSIVRDPQYPLTIYRLAPEVKDALDDYGDALDVLAQEPELKQFQSCYSRLRDKTLRIATLVASLTNSEMIEKTHLAFAQHIVEEFRASIHHLDMFLRQNNHAGERVKTEDGIIAYLKDCKEPKKAGDIRLSNRSWREIDPDKFRLIITNLVKDGHLKVVSRQPGERVDKYEVAK